MGAKRGKTKSIIVSEQTHSRLMELGRKSESFDDIISKVLDRDEQRKEVGN